MTVHIMNVGGGGVGKTSLILQWTKQQFQEEYVPTIEELLTKTVQIDKKTYTVEITDTAGQEEFSQMRWRYIGDNDGFLFDFSIIEKQTLEQLKDLYKDVASTKGTNFHCVLAGNKADKKDEPEFKDKVVPLEDGTKLAKEMKCKYFETSAKTSQNLHELFDELIRGVLKLNNGEGGCCNIF